MAGMLASRRPFPDSKSDPGSLPEDSRLIRALEAYQQALEGGAVPDRDAFLADYPEIAQRLADCLDGMEAIQGVFLGRGVGPKADELTIGGAPGMLDASGSPVMLGDYRLGRELGRGGMGIVFEAMQESLGRRVAVKVLPFAATLDPRQLRRFRTEAQAAARVHHDHIVPVYGFGTERGIHYYAMRLIEGRSLSTLIEQWRVDHAEVRGVSQGPSRIPSPSEGRAFADFVAALGIQAADALEHAHEEGVLHRDIKPANLLVDDSGHLWITDFGLARIQARSSLTRSGDLIGTLRYMSPEQARGEHAAVDRRSDIYSLGATLYEVLTRAPVFEGSVAQELVHRLLHEMPKEPRKVEPGIPRDLETIVLKALSKDPADRYESAAELAEDLRRFRDARPIRARRPAASERLTRWVRRHKSAVATATALMLAALLAQSVTIMLLAIEGRRAQANATRASQTALRLYDTADALDRRIAEQLGTAPADAEACRQLLETTVGIYEQFARDAEEDPSLVALAASAFRKAGDINLCLGHHSRAERCYRRALVRLNTAGPDDSADDDRGAEIAHLLNGLGQAVMLAGNSQDALDLLDQAVEVQEGYVRRAGRGDDRLALIDYLVDLGRLSALEGDRPRSDRAMNRALVVADQIVERDATVPTPSGPVEKAQALRELIRGRQSRGDLIFSAAAADSRSALDASGRLIAEDAERPDPRLPRPEAASGLAGFLSTCRPDSTPRDEAKATRSPQRSGNRA